MIPIRAVLFDWGDTLFESPHAPTVIVDAARAAGVALDDVEAGRMWDDLWAAGKTPAEHAKGRDLSREAHRRVWTDLFARTNSRVPGLDRVLYERVMDPARWIPYPDTEPTLRQLRARGLPVGIVSNTAHDLRPYFAAKDLDRYVDAYALSYEIGAQKPDARTFQAACAMLGSRPAETLMIGDDPVSDAGAGAAGLQVYILPPQMEAGGPRGLQPVIEFIDRSRA